jgi:uroporphyrinogen-III synthase
VLVVRPEVARPTLTDALRVCGARVETVVFYRNVPASGLEAVAREVCAGRFDVVVFTSPSTLDRLLDAGSAATLQLKAALGRARLVAIGPVTAEAIEQAGLVPAAVAPEPTDEAVVGVLCALFS